MIYAVKIYSQRSTWIKKKMKNDILHQAKVQIWKSSVQKILYKKKKTPIASRKLSVCVNLKNEIDVGIKFK